MFRIYVAVVLLSTSTAYQVTKMSSEVVVTDALLVDNQPLDVPGVKKIDKPTVEHLLLKNCTGTIGPDTFRHFPKLKKLTVWRSNLKAITAVSPSITRLVSVGSHLPHFDKDLAGKFPNLQAVMLLGNKDFLVNPLAFKQFSHLQALHISEANFTENCITKEWFRSMENLEELGLSDDRLGCVAEDAFDRLKRLRKLDLTYNGIDALDKTVFKQLRKLEHLGLYGNKLVGFDVGMLGSQRGHLEVLGVDWQMLKESGATAEELVRVLPKVKVVSFGLGEMPNDFRAGVFCQSLGQRGAECSADSVFALGRILGFS